MAQAIEAMPTGMLRISEIYKTIQGESSLVGYPTVFVRLYACNLRCVWCDSMHAVEGGEYAEQSVDDVVHRVSDMAAPAKRRTTRTAASGALRAGRRRAFSPKWILVSPT